MRIAQLDAASIQFISFGLAVAVVSNFSRSPVWRSTVLLGASLVFIGMLAHDATLLLPLASFLLLGYAGLSLIQSGRRKGVLSLGILAVVFAYIWLKKYTFLPESIFLHFPYLTLGMSYIFFRVLHLLIEAADDRERHVGLGAYLLYTLNFTTFISGPIERYEQFSRDQFAGDPLPLGARVIGSQLERIVRGFFKVNVLAMALNSIQEDSLSQLAQPIPLGAKLLPAFTVAVVYPFFLYANFSGYIDIVIALARLMRISLPENFDRPFSAASFLDFWNRWHITLSTWLKTYVYNPLLLALMRRISSAALQPFLGVFCFFVTFFLVGIWHGRTSEFVIFGVLQGGGISLNKLWQVLLTRVLGRKDYLTLSRKPLYIAFARGLTFSWFAFTLFWLWGSWQQIGIVYGSIGGVRWLGVWLAIWCAATATLAIWEWLRAALLSIKTADGPVLSGRYALVVYASALGLVAFVMSILLNQPAPGIVYKAF